MTWTIVSAQLAPPPTRPLKKKRIDTTPEAVERRRESQSGPGAPGVDVPETPKKKLPHDDPEPDDQHDPHAPMPAGDDPIEKDERVGA